MGATAPKKGDARKKRGKDGTEVKMWVCLHCGKNSCARDEDGKPQGHARTYAAWKEHWWAAEFLDLISRYCFSCEWNMAITMSKETLVDGKAVEVINDSSSTSFLVKGMRKRVLLG
ncbi:hypothetical protein SEVIR_2G291100v4 [Setaria viridis]|uniref:UBP-type domain-containing protein n=1 Tax=Setaria viridis TaxID=4556 RepID=A0A4U6W9A4_SETVI|nr:hypothetical protein SEVIR_2G291100v2 [Setaria viridis]TKW34218.1 hypothetical protein SEVIR_2G291100v2 [Setaria viridis]